MTRADRRRFKRIALALEPKRCWSAVYLNQARVVRQALAHSKHRWPDYVPPKQVYRWWKLAKHARMTEGTV